MGSNGIGDLIDDRIDASAAEVWTGVLAVTLVAYLAGLIAFSALPSISATWPFLAVGGLIGVGYLRRSRLRSIGRSAVERLDRIRPGTADEEWGDESAHDWGPDDSVYVGGRDEGDDTDDGWASQLFSDGDEDDDGFGWLQAVTLLSSLLTGSMYAVLDSPWFVGVLVGTAGVVVGARLLAALSPIRDGMAPARRGVPACPSDREDRRS